MAVKQRLAVTQLVKIATMQLTERAENHRLENLLAIIHRPLRVRNLQQACPQSKKCAIHLA